MSNSLKVSELEGMLLDYWVAMTFDPDDLTSPVYAIRARLERGTAWAELWDRPDHLGFRPSTNWAHGGPIIEQDCIELHTFGNPTQWSADPTSIYSGDDYEHINVGPTPLVAAMRAFVRSKFGDQVPGKGQPCT